MMKVLCVAAGSIAGGLARYYLGGFIQHASNSTFPYGTMGVNLLGCLIVGFIASFAGERVPMDHAARLLLITGFCGAFTTFSAFMVESDFLLRGGHAGAAFLNVLVSLLGGFALFHLGSWLAKLV